MALPNHIKAYLACWFQMGKSVVRDAPCQTEQWCPSPVLGLHGFSPEFEQMWQAILAQADHCYLQGTDESVADLLQEHWAIASCSRCGLHIPQPEDGWRKGHSPGPCPCADLAYWPNAATLPPRLEAIGLPQGGQPAPSRLAALKDRLQESYTTASSAVTSAHP